MTGNNQKTPGVVNLVASRVVNRDPLPSLRWCLQLPEVDLVEEHLGQFHDGLSLFRREVTELVLDKVIHSLEHTHQHASESKLHTSLFSLHSL